MNLPAAMLLLICFSTAAANVLECNSGGVKLNTGTGTRTEEPIKIGKKCDKFFGNTLCGREEIIYSGLVSGEGTWYFCGDTNSGNDLCYNKEDGECYDESGRVGEIQRKRKICCSSDRIFHGLPSLFPPSSVIRKDSPKRKSTEKPTATSSPISTRALFTIITALLGRIF